MLSCGSSGLYWAVSSPRPWALLCWCLLSQSDLSGFKSPILELLLKFHSLGCTLILCNLPTTTPDFFKTVCLDTSLPVFQSVSKILYDMGTPDNLEWYFRFFHVHIFVTEATLLFPCYVGKNSEKIQYVKIQCTKILSRLFISSFLLLSLSFDFCSCLSF